VRISEFAHGFLRFISGRGASPRTITTYALSLDQFVAFLRSDGLEDDIRYFTPEQIDAFVTALAGRGLKGSSISLKLSALKSLGEYGKRAKGTGGRYLLDENPLDRVYRPKRERPAEKYLYAEELKALLAAQGPAPVRLAIALLADTALRASEVCSANVGDLSLDGGTTVLQVKVKGGRWRRVRLGADVATALRQSIEAREARDRDPLLVTARGLRFTKASLSEAVLRVARGAGITRVPVRCHVIRHSVATLASATGAEVPTIAALLNHAGLGAVQHYVHRHDAVDAAREAVRAALR
jgi:site-specific recombinase XerD